MQADQKIIWLVGLVGLFDKAGLFERILDRISPLTRKVRNAELSVFFLTIVGNIITAGSARSIVAFGPVAKQIGDRHNLAPKRNANIMDALATGTIMFVPYYPGVMLVAILTGWGREFKDTESNKEEVGIIG